MAYTLQQVLDEKEERESFARAAEALREEILKDGPEAAVEKMIDHKLYIPPDEMERILGGYYESQPLSEG